MLHPSYTDLMETINSETEGDTPVVNSRYSIVLATAKRARQLIAGEEAYVNAKGKKPLSIAVEELYSGKIKILGEDEEIGGDMLDLAEDISGEEIEISEEEAEETTDEAETETEA